MVTSNATTKCVHKISMLRLKIVSGMLRLSSCMLSLGLTLDQLRPAASSEAEPEPEPEPELQPEPKPEHA